MNIKDLWNSQADHQNQWDSLGEDEKLEFVAAQPAQEPWNEDEWRRNNWRCHHGWLRGEQCLICNAAQEPVADRLERLLWEYIDLQAAHPEHRPDLKTWPHLMIYAPQPADNPYGYDWSMLEAAQESLREHMARIKELEAQLAQPAQEPEMLTIVYQSGYHDGKQAALAGREWNFCERCGKRTADLTIIHTCTPPQGDA
jgi:hypothetical protein